MTKDVTISGESKPLKSPKPRRRIQQMDLGHEPVFLVLHQTPTSNVLAVFGGATAEDDAHAHAQELAGRLKTMVAVFGPQWGAYAPPEKPAVRALELNA